MSDRPVLPGWHQLHRAPSSESIAVKKPPNQGAGRKGDARKTGQGQGKPMSYFLDMKGQQAGQREQGQGQGKPMSYILDFKEQQAGQREQGQGQGKPMSYILDFKGQQGITKTAKGPPKSTEERAEKQADARRDFDIRTGVRLVAVGPLPEGDERNFYVGQIIRDVDKMCLNEKGKLAIAQSYIYTALGYDENGIAPHPYYKGTRLGELGNPFLWVLTDRHVKVDKPIRVGTATVFAFCIAALIHEPSSIIYEVKAVCSMRKNGMTLMEAALRHGLEVWKKMSVSQKTGKTYYVHIHALTPNLSVKYNEIATKVFGKSMRVTERGTEDRYMSLLFDDWSDVLSAGEASNEAQGSASGAGSSSMMEEDDNWFPFNSQEDKAHILDLLDKLETPGLILPTPVAPPPAMPLYNQPLAPNEYWGSHGELIHELEANGSDLVI